MGQGESIATFADPLVQRQSIVRQTSDRKQRQTNTGHRRENLAYAQEESAGSKITAATRLPGATIAANLHSQKQWKEKTLEHRHNERPSDANPVQVGLRPDS